MDVERLITMANDIAAFFDGTEAPQVATAKVAEHLRLYWHPRMRAQLVAHFNTGGAGLSELSATAVALLAHEPRDDRHPAGLNT